MNVIAGILAAVAVYVLLEKQHQSIAQRQNVYGVQARGPRPTFSQSPAAPALPANTFQLPGADAATADLQFATSGFQDFSSLAGSGALGSGLEAAKAIPIAGAIIGVAAGIAGSLLAAHRARIKGATDENRAADSVVPSYDAFLQGIGNAVKNRQIDPATAIQTLQQFDQANYQKLRSFVGKPGTKWRDKGNGGPATSFETTETHTGTTCDRSCTVGCCIYYNSLAVGVENMISLIQGHFARWDSGDKGAQVRRDLGAYIPAVGSGASGAGSQYSHFRREAYWINIR